jgi:hypothetical protein
MLLLLSTRRSVDAKCGEESRRKTSSQREKKKKKKKKKKKAMQEEATSLRTNGRSIAWWNSWLAGGCTP